jgi:hypothetical protein
VPLTTAWRSHAVSWQRPLLAVALVSAASPGCRFLLNTEPLWTDGGPSTNDAQSDAKTKDVAHVEPTHEASSPREAASESDAKPSWGALSLVQFAAMRTSSIAFAHETTAGNLLLSIVALSGDPPDGAGWTLIASDGEGDTLYAWPNNPGSLRAFTLPKATDTTLLEFHGAPPLIGLGAERDTGPQEGSVTTLSVMAPAPTMSGALEILYLGTTGAERVEAADGWQYIGTDNDDDYSWWKVGDTSAPTASVTFSPAAPGCLMLVTFRAG